MGDKLFFFEPDQLEFSTDILRIDKDKTGNYALLKDSYFYPESGGQPSDYGMINDTEIFLVKEINDQVRHYFNGELQLGKASCKIDAARRFDHMQQHSGQHILSAVFYDFLAGETSSFTIGDKNSTIEISIDHFDPTLALEVMKRSNHMVYKNLPIESRIYEKDEWRDLPLRKQPAVEDNIRIVSIPDFDYSPCGGTHCHFTGEVGAIHISGWEKLKNSYRILFTCGDRNTERVLESDLLLKKSSSLLSVPPEDLSLSIERLQAERRELEKENERLLKSMLLFEAEKLFSTAVEVSADGKRNVIKGFSERSFEEIRMLGAELIRMGVDKVLLYLEDVSAAPESLIRVVLNRSDNLDEDLGKLGKELFLKYGGKGGGSPKAAQGSIQKAFLADFLAEVIKNCSI